MEEEAPGNSRPARSERPRRRSRFRAAPALLAWFILSSAPVPSAAEESSHGCLTCGGSGKSACPSCGGKGEIWKPCPICNGTGRKPCPVCASEEKRSSSSAVPGRLPCRLCGGKGTRVSGRTCSRCLGEQSTACTTCIGKGTMRCRKQVFDTVCPACKFVGKVDCPTCKGGLPVPTGNVATSKRIRRQEAEATANGKAAAGDLEARYAKITGLHDSHLDIFGDDPRPRLEPLRVEAARALKSLKAEGAADAASAEAIESFLSRLGSFRLRWGEIRELFLDEYRSVRTAKAVWAARERLVAESKGSLRRAAEKQWGMRMDTALTIAEQRAAALEAAEPAWLPKEATDLAAIWTNLRGSAESDLALAVAASKARPDARPAAASEEGANEPGDAEEASPGDDIFTPVETAAVLEAPTDDGAAEVVSPLPAEATEAAPVPPGPSKRGPARRADPPPGGEDSGEAAHESREEGGSEGLTDVRSWPILWSAAGFAAATALFAIIGRRRRSRAQD